MIALSILINVIGAISAYALLRKSHCDADASLGGAIICWPLGILLFTYWKLTAPKES
jgi:hypothetical protein